MYTRKVTVFNTVGQNKRVIETTAETWADLQGDLTQHRISFAGMKAVIGENQNTLESPQGQLIQGDMTLFLLPRKVKSGYNNDSLIDWEYGSSWRDFNEDEDIVEEGSYKTAKDLAIIRLKKAGNYIECVIDHLINDQSKTTSDPEVSNLNRIAEDLKRNLNLFD